MNNFGSNEGSGPVQELLSTSGDIILPDGFGVSDLTFSRDGADLMIEAPSGETFFVSDYYTADYPMDILGSDGSLKHGSDLQDVADTSSDDIQLAQVQIEGLNIPASDTSASLTGEPIGTVENVQGVVTVTRADGTQTTLGVGDSVFQGDTIETPEGAGVGVTLADTSNFSLGENSEMVLDELVYDPGSQEGSAVLSLIQGTTSYVSGQIAKINPNAVSIDTPVATIGIRGTKVFVEYQDGKFNAINLMETTLEGEQPGEIVIFDINGTPLGIVNQANIGWSFDSATDSQPVSTTFSAQDVESLTGSTTSMLPASLAEEARNAREIEEALKEAAAIAEEEAAEAKAKADEAEAEKEKLAEEAMLAEEKAQTLLTEAEQAELAAEQARLLLEQLMTQGADQSAILQAENRLNNLEDVFQSLMSSARVAQSSAINAMEELAAADHLLTQANKTYQQAYDAMQTTLSAMRDASEAASNAYARATTYVGYEANYKFEDREDQRESTQQFASNFQTQTQTQPQGPEQRNGDDEITGSSYDDILVQNNNFESQSEEVFETITEIFSPENQSGLALSSGEGEGADQQNGIEPQDEAETTTLIETQTTQNASQSISGTGVDGYLSGSRVFIDLDEDGVWDEGEDYTFTDGAGKFTLTTTYTDRELTITGGTDIATGKSFYGVLSAPSGSEVVSPLTTLLSSMVESGQTLDAAKAQLATAFGLDPSIDLTTTDPIAGAAAGNVAMAKIAAVAVQIQNTIMQAGRAMEGASSTLSSDDAAEAIFNSLASKIIANGNATYDISDTTKLQDVFNTAAGNVLSGAELTKATDAAANTAQIISSSNTVINTYIESGGTGSSFLSSIAQVQVVADDASNALKTTIDTGGDLAALQTDYTINLSNKIESATVQDVTGDGNTNTANSAPTVGNAVNLNATEDTSLTITTAQLVANSSDTDDDTLSVTNLQASSGTLVNNNDGTWTLTPAANSSDTINLTYNVSDGVKSTSATGTITVAAVNDAPTVSAAVSLADLNEDTPVTVSQAQLLANASDIEGDALSVSNVSATGGSVVVNDNGTWTITPDANSTSEVTLTYTITDANNATVSQTATIDLIAVNDAPTVSSSLTLDAVNEDTPVTLTKAQLLANATDVDGDTLDIINVTATGGLAVDNGNETWTVTPDLNATGDVTLSYTVSDMRGGTVNQTATIDITPQNDAPVLSFVSLDAATEDQTYTINASDLIASSVASDVDGDSLSVTNVSVSHGSVSETSEGVWTVVPQSNYAGTVTVTYTVSDGTTTTTNTSNLVYNSVNDAPVISDSSVSLSNGTEDTAYTVNASDLLANNYATDVDHENLSVVNLATTAQGQLVKVNDTTWSFTPASNFTGEVAFTFDVTDGIAVTSGGRATINFANVNDAPVTSGNVLLSATAGQEMTFTSEQLLSLASDVDGDTLSVSSVTIGETTLIANDDGNWVYTPTETGALNISYTISDGTTTVTANAVANVAAPQQPPNTLPETSPVTLSGTEDNALLITKAQLLANASDADEDTLYIVNLATTDGGVLVNNNNDTWTYTPAENANGNVAFTYKISDGTGTIDASATLTLAAVNDAPVVTDTVNLSGTEDQALTITAAQLVSKTTDVDSENLSVSELSASSGNLVQNENGSWTLTPVENSTSDVTFTYKVTDDGNNVVNASATASFVPVNDAPTVSSNVTLSGNEDQNLTITKDQLLANANDVDGDTLIVQNLRTDDGGTLAYNGNDTWTYSPVANSTSNVTFNYNVYDGTTTVAAQAIASFEADGTLEGTNNGDTIIGTDGVDHITALFGDDTLTGGAGNDTLDGGEGTDVAVFSGNLSDYSFGVNDDGNLTITDNNPALDGNDGTDVLLSIEAFQFKDQLLTEIPDDDADDANASDDTILGGNGVDMINSGDGDDEIFGFNGGDTIDAGSGNDTIWAGNGSDTIDGGEGVDKIYADTGTDLIIMDSGDAIINGGTGTDTIRLEDGDDIDFTSTSTLFESIEIIDLLTDTDSNTLTLTATNVQSISGTNKLIISGGGEGDNQDIVNLSGGGWTTGRTDNNGYTSYDHSDSNVQVQISQTVNVTGV